MVNHRGNRVCLVLSKHFCCALPVSPCLCSLAFVWDCRTGIGRRRVRCEIKAQIHHFIRCVILAKSLTPLNPVCPASHGASTTTVWDCLYKTT